MIAPSPQDTLKPMKIRASLTLPALLCTGLAFPCAATPLEITGEVTASTCLVNDSNGPIHINLGRTSLSRINSLTRRDDTAFAITVSCPGSTGAQQIGLQLTGPADPVTGAIALDGPSSATRIGVAILTGQGEKLRMDEQPITLVNVPAGGQRQLDFIAALVPLGNGATAGSVLARAELTLIYR